MYIDYVSIVEDVSSSRNFLNSKILPNIYNNSINISKYAKNLYPVELHIHILSHICSKHRTNITFNNNYRLNVLDGIYKQCLGELISQKLNKILDNCNSDILKINNYKNTLLPAGSIFATEQLESTISRTHKNLALALISHWNTYNLNPKSGSNVATINLKPIDIGSKGSTFIINDAENENVNNSTLYFDHDKTFTLQGLNLINNVLTTLGFVVIKNVLSDKHIQAIRESLSMDGKMARDIAFSILEEDSNVNAAKYTRGRITCSLRGTTYDSKLRRIQKFWTPILHYIMPRSITSIPQKFQTSVEKSLYISWINLILSDPLSDYDSWFRNNSKYGITVVIPLDSRSDDDGRIEFIPHTHSIDNKNSSILNAIRKGPIGVNVNPGDLIIYNSSILHRYTMNRSFDCKSDLIYQYDYLDSIPPGQGRLKFMYDNLLAKFIILCNKLY